MEPGTTLAGRYRLERRLGQGGFSEVWQARDLLIPRDVAVKVRVEIDDDPDTERRFRRGELLGASLHHPGITVVYDVGEHNGRLFVVRELLDGQDLRGVILASAADGGLPVWRAVDLAAQAAEALAAVHDKGIVHRDVKPANLFVQTGDRVKLGDFTLAWDASDTLDREGYAVGTPHYMAPEALEAERPPRGASDLYALGCSIYEMLTGHTPFHTATNFGQLISQHFTGIPAPPHDLNPAVPGPLSDLVLALLAKEPAGRPGSATLVTQALREIQGSLGRQTAPDAGARTAGDDPGGEQPEPVVQAGTVLAGRYRLSEPLGNGAMGRVWLAQDLNEMVGRSVAVKLMLSAQPDQAMLDRFRREAMIAARLGHPGILTVYDAGTHKGRLFIVMERLTGKDLKDVLADFPHGLPAGRAVTLGIQLADALAVVHERHIVHRDLKPANLFVQPGDRLKVCDFGIARDNSQTVTHTRFDSVLGTPFYVPPERWNRSGPVAPASDLYAVGCILYEMLTGTSPFADADSIGVLIARHLHAAPVPPRDRSPAVPAALNSLVLRLLAKDPADRPASAGVVAKTLRAVQQAP